MCKFRGTDKHCCTAHKSDTLRHTVTYQVQLNSINWGQIILMYFCVLKLHQIIVGHGEAWSALLKRNIHLLNRQYYSSLFMRHVFFSIFMVARSVELVKTSRSSSCLSSSVSASSARFFSCISICLSSWASA